MQFVIFLLFVVFFKANCQIVVKDLVSGSSREISFGTKIFYKLHSDSVLGTEITPDYGVLITTSDTNLVLTDGTEIPASDISYLEIDNKSLKKWRGIAKPFLIAGMGFLSKGLIMAIGEGNESKNAELIPVYTGIGAVTTGISIIPFLRKNKSYDLSNERYQIITP